MIAPYPGNGPIIINNASGPDPYANTGALQPGWFPNTIGGYVPGPMSISERLWVRAEYLYWWTEGMELPALVTTSPAGTAQDQAAILGEPGTEVLFGGGSINDDAVSGARFRSGFWLTQQGTFAIESEYFQLLGAQDDGFSASSDGSTILGRPFFDITNGRETAQLVSFPDLVAGDLRITSDSDLKSLLINGRAGLCPVGLCNVHGDPDRVDWIVGYRYLDLDDQISFVENLNSLVPNTPGTVAIRESFHTSNEFNGLQLGIIHQAKFRRAWLESLLRVAIGNNTQTVNIGGTTAITEDGVTENFASGLLAQRSNIGKYEREEFTMIPEVGLTFGFHLTEWLDATVGYTMLYFPNVVRAGDQIDTDVNPNLLAPEADPFTGALRPRQRYIESEYWAQGLSLGAELRF